MAHRFKRLPDRRRKNTPGGSDGRSGPQRLLSQAQLVLAIQSIDPLVVGRAPISEQVRTRHGFTPPFTDLKSAPFFDTIYIGCATVWLANPVQSIPSLEAAPP